MSLKQLFAPIMGLTVADAVSAAKLLSVLLALILGVFVLSMGPTAAAEKKMVKDPATGQVLTAPEYGGSITYAQKCVPPNTDIWFSTCDPLSGVSEKLGIGNWATDRDLFRFQNQLFPLFAIKGQLAQSWETPDPLTYVFKIRSGVKWHNKAPMSGRELTASDVEYSFHRMLGLGSGFSEPTLAGICSALVSLPFESVTTTDKWTVVIKLKAVNLDALREILIGPCLWVLPPEVIQQHGDIKDWRDLVGTGPWMMTEWVEGSSMTYDKNPDYWGTDEKYPENRLPYTDRLKGLIMKEDATILAALRSGRLDYAGSNTGADIKSIDQVFRLQQMNPEIELFSQYNRSNQSFALDMLKPPFDDIRVRIAMQKALDLETINKTFFKSYAKWKPQGMLGDGLVEYHIPFEEWPEEIKERYTYDPEGAETLLDEAGYPRGADGIRFKTTLENLSEYFPLDYAELAAAYWADIGVHVQIKTVDVPRHISSINEHTFEGMVNMVAAIDYSVMWGLQFLQSTFKGNRPGFKDPAYDAMVDAASAATTIEEQIKLAKEADMYQIKNFTYVWGPKVPSFNAIQAWVKGYYGESDLGLPDRRSIFARLWIDQELKKEMGF